MANTKPSSTFLSLTDNGRWVFLQKQTASASANIVFTGLDTYNHIIFEIYDIDPATAGANFYAYFSNDGGSTYSSSNIYGHSQHVNNASTETNINYSNTAFIQVANDVWSGGTGAGMAMTLQCSLGATTGAFPSFYWHGQYKHNTAGSGRMRGGATYNTAAWGVDAVKFQFSTGNITSGNIVAYGLLEA